MSRADQINEIFDRAAELPQEQRDAFLDEACGQDLRLREEVEALLAADGAAGEFLTDITYDPKQMARALADVESIGSVIGRYKLVEHLGDGGFGSVFLAEQERPVKRRVALKIIKLGMDTRAVIARFQAERQALAMMDHPNIARVLDAGATATGRPYFVMEYVPGEAITSFCDRERLSIQQRIRLLIEVCRAVQHAHQKGIIHRDLKPNNILVSTIDNRPAVKVIDFGIAKATSGERLAGQSIHTEQLGPIGTPAYMSPEQADIGTRDIDTRTDVYSLGVVLYELLTGNTPLDLASTQRQSYGDVQKAIREFEPPRPSTRVRSATAQSVELARKRNVDPSKLRKLLKGDLDWISLRAMEKDRERRYASVAELAADLERHLANEPVAAGPPGNAYRIHKFIRRHRRAVLAATGMVAMLLAAVVAVSWYAVMAHRAQARATQRFNDVRGIARKLMFDFDSAILHVPGTVKARRMLVTTALEYLDKLANDEQDDPQLLVELAEAYVAVGKIQYEPSFPHIADRSGAIASFRKAIDIARQAVARQPKDASANLVLASALSRYCSAGFAFETGPSIAAGEESIEILRRLLADAPDSKQVKQGLGGAIFTLAWALADTNQVDRAIPMYREALSVADSMHDQWPGDIDVLRWQAAIQIMLGKALQTRGEIDEAERLVQAGRAIHVKLAEQDPGSVFVRRSIATADVALAELAAQRGDLRRAATLYAPATAVAEELWKSDPENIQARMEFGRNLHRLAELQFDSGDKESAAETLGTRFLPFVQRRYKPGQSTLVGYQLQYAAVLRAVGRFEDAEKLLRQTEGEAASAGSERFGDVIREQVELYQDWNKPDLAAAARERLKSMPATTRSAGGPHP